MRATGPAIPPRSASYPLWISSDSDRRRWDLAGAIANQMFAEDDPAAKWQATRSIFTSSIPTDDDPNDDELR